jgi:C4-dicarboxylate transporter DctM subunit
MYSGTTSFTLLAIPFFILAGNLMNTGGITDRLVRFARALVGHIRGGLAHVVVVTNMIMAGMSGSGVADAAGSGTVLIPAMKKVGYGVPFSAAIVGAAGTIGPIIPPSIPFVIYGSIAGASIGRLLLGGVIVGLAGAYGVSRIYQQTMPGLQLPGVALEAGITVLLCIVGLAACYLPARRAGRIDPVVALRAE